MEAEKLNAYMQAMKEELDDFVMGERLHGVNLIQYNEHWVAMCTPNEENHNQISVDHAFVSDLSEEAREAFLLGQPIFDQDVFWILTKFDEVEDMTRFLAVVLKRDWQDN